MIRAMVIMILAGLTFLQGLPDGMALNPFAYEFCPERYRPKLVPNPSISPTPTRQHRKIAPESTVEATPTPTPSPWTCPILGDSTKKEYRDACIESCELTGQHGCAGICNQCWKVGD